MKNLLVYISPTGFDKERELLARVQIDNSFSLGQTPKDIVLVTSFPYSYNGVNAFVVGNEHFSKSRPRSIKTSIIPFLSDIGIVHNDEIYWNHDFDAYQMNEITNEELGLDDFDAGLTDYGWRDRWCMGSFFFWKTAADIFEQAKPMIFNNIEDETAMMTLCEQPGIENRCKRLNITYNFGMRHVEDNWKRATHPIKVVHFHPWYPLVKTLDIFMYGKNGMGHPIISDRLKEVLNHHGIK